jgi:hypothetical protein
MIAEGELTTGLGEGVGYALLIFACFVANLFKQE